MSQAHVHRRVVMGVMLLGIVLVGGCYMTKVALIDPATAKVEKALVGNWDNPEAFDAAGREGGLVIRNVDDKLLYIEWKLKGEGNLVRAVGFTTDVKGATFAQVRGLDEDGGIADEWMLMRVDLAGDKLALRQLDDGFFKEKSVDTSAQLRQILENNLDNPAMYGKDEVITATRVAKK